MSISDEGPNPFEQAERWETRLDGEQFLTKGNHLVTITEAKDGTSRNEFPQIELRFRNEYGIQAKKLVYKPEFLGRVASLYDCAGKQRPQIGEFDREDQCRIKQPALDRLVGSSIGIVVVEEAGYNDPRKTYNVVDGFVEPARISDSPDMMGQAESGEYDYAGLDSSPTLEDPGF